MRIYSLQRAFRYSQIRLHQYKRKWFGTYDRYKGRIVIFRFVTGGFHSIYQLELQFIYSYFTYDRWGIQHSGFSIQYSGLQDAGCRLQVHCSICQSTVVSSSYCRRVPWILLYCNFRNFSTLIIISPASLYKTSFTNLVLHKKRIRPTSGNPVLPAYLT